MGESSQLIGKNVVRSSGTLNSRTGWTGMEIISKQLLIMVKRRLTGSKLALLFTWLQYKSFKNTVGKGEIAKNEQFLLYTQCFLPIWRTLRYLHQIQNRILQAPSVWKSLKLGKGLTPIEHISHTLAKGVQCISVMYYTTWMLSHNYIIMNPSIHFVQQQTES